MRQMAINPCFVNKAGTDLIPGKIHTIRQNYAFWKKFEGKDIELYIWEGKAYQKGSTHKVVCVKRIVSVQKVLFNEELCGKKITSRKNCWFEIDGCKLPVDEMVKNDGFSRAVDFKHWFWFYPSGEMGIVHFTNFKY